MLQVSLWDLVKSQQLPFSVSVISYKPEDVFRKEQYLSILQKKCVQLLSGIDYYGQRFQLSVDDIEQVQVECVEDFHPNDENEVLNLETEEVTYLLLTKRFGIGNKVCESGERFICKDYSTDVTAAGKLTLSFIREKDESIMHLPVETLTNREIFVFIKVKETINLQTLLRSFKPQKVVFKDAIDNSTLLPRCVSIIEAVGSYDTILTATVVKNRCVRYETFLLHNQVLVENYEQEMLPDFVKILKEKSAVIYQQQMDEIEVMMRYDIYAPRFYGYYDAEIELSEKDQLLMCEDLESLTKRSKKPIVESQSFDQTMLIREHVNVNFERPQTLYNNDMQKNKKGILSSMKKLLGKTLSSPISSPLNENHSKYSNTVVNLASPTSLDNYEKSTKEYPLHGFDATPKQDSELASGTTTYHGEGETNELSFQKRHSSDPIAARRPDPLTQLVIPLIKDLTPLPSEEINFCNDLSDVRAVDDPIYVNSIVPAELSNDPIYVNSIASSEVKTNTRARSSSEKVGKKEMALFYSSKPVPAPRKLKQVEENVSPRSYSTSCLNSTSHHENKYTSTIYEKMTAATLTLQQEVESIHEIRNMTVEEVSQLLSQLGLEKYSSKFKKEMINGNLLYKIEKKDFHDDLGLSKFESNKLDRYIRGWRPNTKTLGSHELKRAHFTSWSIENVRNELISIKLHDFAAFCENQQVDGKLLSDMFQENMMSSIIKCHEVKLTAIEYKRLRSYVTKELKYEDHEKIKPSL